MSVFFYYRNVLTFFFQVCVCVCFILLNLNEVSWVFLLFYFLGKKGHLVN